MNMTAAADPAHDLHRQRLFVGSCLSLISTSVTFAVVGAIANALKETFILTNAQVGMIMGAATWGFTISIFVLGPLCDVLGMKNLMRFAFLCHVAGPLLMIFANGFTMLFFGALIVSMANGTVEAVCNPLVATLYPDRKTEKLNQFHVWFPGGIVIGAVSCFLLDNIGFGMWQAKLCLILVPTVIYGFLMLFQKFPPTESHASGVGFGDMFRFAFTRPLFWLLLFCMALTASVELGPNRWVPAILESGGIHGILVLAWINLLMAVMRFFAGHVIERLAPTGILLMSAILAGLGLLWLSFAESTGMAFAAATLFAVGVCYFWPTMIGVTSERIPKGGPLALALMGGVGMLAVGLVTTPKMGEVSDSYLVQRLDPAATTAIFEKAVATYPALKDNASPEQDVEIDAGIAQIQSALDAMKSGETLVGDKVPNALREVMKMGGSLEAAGEAKALLGPAENSSGRMAFRYVVPLTAILAVIFGSLFVSDKMKGGYKIERIGGSAH
jgi:MFS family permease